MKNKSTTDVLSDAVKPTVPPVVEVTGEVVLSWTPISMAVTSTEKVQETPGARVAPDKLMLFVPPTATIAPPPQEPVRLLGVDTMSPLGNMSLKAMPASGIGFAAGLPTVKLRLVLLPGPNTSSCESRNALLMVGGTTKVNEAEAVPPVH